MNRCRRPCHRIFLGISVSTCTYRTVFVVLVDCFLYLCAPINKYSGWGINFVLKWRRKQKKFRHKINKSKIFFGGFPVCRHVAVAASPAKRRAWQMWAPKLERKKAQKLADNKSKRKILQFTSETENSVRLSSFHFRCWLLNRNQIGFSSFQASMCSGYFPIWLSPFIRRV